MSTTKLLLILPLVAALGYLALLGLMYFSQRALLYPGANAAFAPVAQAEWGEKISIATPDGETLHALYSNGDPGKPSVLFFLGNADYVGNYRFLAEALVARGIGLLAVSYRGYAGSTGSPTEEGLLTDGLAAFDWLSAQTGGEIVLLGQSLGSGVAVNAAAQRPAAGVILVSAYLSVLSLAQTHYPFLPVALLIKDSFRSDLRIGEVRQPKLFIHGRLDNIVPLSSGEALHAIAPEPKEILVYDAYGHNDLWNEGMTGEIIRFVEALNRGGG